MRFVLDTDVLSTFRRKQPHAATVSWIEQIGWQSVATTVVSVTEIQRGIERARHHHPETASQTEAWLERLLAEGEPQVLPLAAAAARVLGRMYESPALRNFIITDPNAKWQATGADLAIAAIAITSRSVVVTNNVGHFLQINEHFPLSGLFAPADQTWHVQLD